MADTALSKLKVIDLSWYISGPYCTKLFADFGADVIKIERPETGDPSRQIGPFRNDEENVNASGLYAYLNNNKKSITLDLKTEEGIDLVKRLVSTADIVVENFAPGVLKRMGLGYDVLKEVNPKIILTSISTYGQTGDYAHYKGTEFIAQALGGYMTSVGEPTREPLRAGGQLHLLEYIAGTFAAGATLAAVRGRNETGEGAHLDIPIANFGILQISYPTVQNSYPTSLFKADMRRPMIPSVHPCKDGFIGISVLTGQQWQNFCFMTEMYDWVEDERFMTLPKRLEHKELFLGRLNQFLSNYTREELMQFGSQWRVPVTPVPTFSDIMDIPHYKERAFFEKVAHKELGDLWQPGAPFRMSETPWAIRNAAPLLGEHTDQILSNMMKTEAVEEV